MNRLSNRHCKLIKEITTQDGQKISQNLQSFENTGIAVRLSVSRILVYDLRRHLSWEYRGQVEVSAVTFLALNINRTKKSQELPARFSLKRRPLPCQKIIRRNTAWIMTLKSIPRMIYWLLIFPKEKEICKTIKYL